VSCISLHVPFPFVSLLKFHVPLLYIFLFLSMLELWVVEWVVLLVLRIKINLWTGLSSRAVRPLSLPLCFVLLVLFSLFAQCWFSVVLGFNLVGLIHCVSLDFASTKVIKPKFGLLGWIYIFPSPFMLYVSSFWCSFLFLCLLGLVGFSLCWSWFLTRSPHVIARLVEIIGSDYLELEPFRINDFSCWRL